MGDIHLDTFSSFALPVDNPISNSRLENILGAMRLAFKTGAEQGITNYVINGDLFNQRLKVNPSFFNYCIQSVVEMYRGCPDNSTLWITVGNHDSQTRFMKPNSVDILSSFSTENHKIIVAQDLVEVHKLEDETALALVSFTEDVESSKKMLSDQLDYVTKNKLKTAVFAHLGVSGSELGKWGHKMGGAYSLYDLGYNNPYIQAICCSHIHKRQKLVPYVNTDLDKKTAGIQKKTLETIDFNINKGYLKVNKNGHVTYDSPEHSARATKDSYGYMIIHLFDKEGKRHNIRVHDIVAFSEWGWDIEGKVIDHRNNKHGAEDNYLGNLHVLTNAQNTSKGADEDNNVVTPCKAYDVYTAKYISHYPKAWYIGDLTELNFNDVNEDGTGAPRGFDIIDTETGESEFYDLSDKFPKFMIYDLDQDKIDIDELIESMNKNYVKIVVHDKDVYQKLTKAYKEQHKEGTPYANIQLKVKPKQEQELEIGATESDADILGKYMDKFYQDKDLKDLALSYLERAEE